MLAPVADAFVDAANPSTNYGMEPDLLVDRAPDTYETMLRFDVPRLTAPVQRAVLRLYVTNPSPNGPAVSVTTNAWDEERVTWETRPRAGGSVVANPGNVPGGWLELDVTRAVTASGELSFVLVPEHDDGADFDSREGTRPPELVVTTGVSEPPPPSRGITHVGTTQTYDSNGQGLVIDRPSGSAEGDLLVLVLHRTDDDLPLYVDGWTRVAECFKGDNGHQCGTEAMCRSWHDDDFCADFGSSGNGHDLAQSVFYRAVGSREPSSYRFDLNRDGNGHPGWAVLTALRGARTTNPVRDWAGVGCDRNDDSIFPSVEGAPGDMLLLSQSFDDAIPRANFLPPSGTSLFGYVSRSDEAGFLFGGLLGARGETGTRRTGGPGGPACKDALVSLTIMPR
ncbi:MAG: DNRLRE domain-containing protein [Polyangiales bacterium]